MPRLNRCSKLSLSGLKRTRYHVRDMRNLCNLSDRLEDVELPGLSAGALTQLCIDSDTGCLYCSRKPCSVACISGSTGQVCNGFVLSLQECTLSWLFSKQFLPSLALHCDNTSQRGSIQSQSYSQYHGQ